MSKIKDLLRSKDSVFVFDVDGVLALLEFGEYRHYELTDEEWAIANDEGKNFYTKSLVSPKMQKFIETKNKKNVYCITAIYNDAEVQNKIEFLKHYYNIPKSHIFFVEDSTQKVDALFSIKEKYPDLEDWKVVMVEDTVDNLNLIMEKTPFSTVHISSFLDLEL